MNNRIFKILAACFTLLLYLSTMVASDVVALTCHCLTFHSEDNHIEHTHSLHHAHHHSECGDCCHSDMQSIAPSISLQESDCGCAHDHSTNIELYIQPRIADDETQLRYAAAVVVNDMTSCAENCEALVKSDSYGVYLLPPLSAAHRGSSSLRAPPSLV